jgi:hypothetical protein
MLDSFEEFKHEKHNHPIKWTKAFLFGALSGVLIGTCWFMIKPSQAFTMRKLLAATGERPWSGRYFR